MYDYLFVTTSTYKMFKLSGIHLVNSFIDHQHTGILLYLTEDFKLPISHNKILSQDLSNYPFLTEWISRFKHIIPKKLGGSYNTNKNKKKYLFMTESDGNNWNYKSSLWFRKLASLHFALTNYKFKHLIWIDNDCIIKKHISNDVFIKKFFHKTDLFFFLGKFRKSLNMGVESGFMGFRNTGFAVLHIIFDIFLSGKFISLYRWDDGWVFKYIISTFNKLNCFDLGSLNISNNTHVMDFHPISVYIIHKKGSHFKHCVDIP